jgi:serine-type D-Ala-D-Ala carboxypeptidase/endopeptidase (penicillin-binding protein 4)
MSWRRRCLALALLASASCSAADLEHRIDALLESSASAGMGFVGIHVANADSGALLYKRNEDRLFLPASNWKLVTTAMALDRLGPDYRFETHVIRDAAGNLVLVGAGDPSLGGRITIPKKTHGAGPRNSFAENSALSAIEALADRIVAYGITRVDGDIVGDDRVFAWEPYPASWTQDDTVRDFGAPVSALALNENIVTIAVKAGLREGDFAPLTLQPSFEYLTLENRVITVSRSGQTKITVTRTGPRVWRMEGTIAIGHSAKEELPVDDPALFAASALYDALTRRGVSIHGSAGALHRIADEAFVPTRGEAVATYISPSLQELLEVTDKFSINLYAEAFLREVGRNVRGEGSTTAGLAELGLYLKDMGVASRDWRADDGSGLSRNDVATPRLFTQVLADQYKRRGAEFVALLPAGGEEGTLDRRLCCVSEGLGIHAKTGTLARALALSGFAESKANGRLAFSILVNDFSAPASEVRAWIDKIASALLDESSNSH